MINRWGNGKMHMNYIHEVNPSDEELNKEGKEH